MIGISSVFHGCERRRSYMRVWRDYTSYDWRAANAASRRRHAVDRREYDRKRYQAKRILALMQDAYERQWWLEVHR